MAPKNVNDLLKGKGNDITVEKNENKHTIPKAYGELYPPILYIKNPPITIPEVGAVRHVNE